MPPSSFLPHALYTGPPSDLSAGNLNNAYNVSYADRANLLAIRTPRPLPEWWAKMNGIRLQDLRAREQTFGRVCVALNQIPEYVSPTALYNQDAVLAQLSKRVKTFYAVVQGKVVCASTHSPHAVQSIQQTVQNVKNTVASQGGAYLNNISQHVTHFGTQLKRVIGSLVHPLLSGIFPSLAPQSPSPSVDSDNSTEWCDADYSDDGSSAPSSPMYTGAAPVVPGNMFGGDGGWGGAYSAS